MEHIYLLLVTYDPKIPYQLFTKKAYRSIKECEDENMNMIKKLKEIHKDKVWFTIEPIPIVIQGVDMFDLSDRAKFVALSNFASFYIGGLLTMIPDQFKDEFYKSSKGFIDLMEKIQNSFKK